MKFTAKYIALLLVVIFSITILPFNAFHQHEEDEHAFAVLSHEAHHSCELDDNICQGEYTGTCGHVAHIGKAVTKCFSCQFHFIKAFNSELFHAKVTLPGTLFIFTAQQAPDVITYASAINNKGPPAAVKQQYS